MIDAIIVYIYTFEMHGSYYHHPLLCYHHISAFSEQHPQNDECRMIVKPDVLSIHEKSILTVNMMNNNYN
jgi:hypothetical protein